MYTYSKQFTLPAKAQTYVVEIVLDEQPDDIELFKQHLSEVIDAMRVNPKSLARYFFKWCRTHWMNVNSVRVSDVPGEWEEWAGG